MIRLYLVRHGRAKSDEEDPARPLNDTGIAQAQASAEALKDENITVAAIWHSGKARAQGTAEIMASAVNCESEPVAREGFKPNDPVQPIADEIEARGEPLMIVGHLPFLGKLVGYLTTGRDEETVSFGEAEVVTLEKDESGKWKMGEV